MTINLSDMNQQRMNITFPYLYFTALALFIGCNEKKESSDVEREIALENNIQVITEYKTDINPGGQGAETISRISYFDNNGYKTEEKVYASNSTIEGIIKNEYDSEGNNIISTNRSPSGDLIYRIEKTFDKDNRRKELTHFLTDGSFRYKNISYYDDEGNLKELHWFRTEGFVSKNLYNYQDDKLVEDIEYAPDGKVQYRWSYKYNPLGKLIEKIQYYPDSSQNSRITYKYKGDLLVKETNYAGKMVSNVIEYTYTDKKLLSRKKVLSSGGSFISTYKYKYEYY